MDQSILGLLTSQIRWQLKAEKYYSSNCNVLLTSALL